MSHTEPTGPASLRTSEVVLTLLEQSRMCLAEAAASTRATQRYALAHLGALRAAAAVLSARAVPGAGPGSGSGRRARRSAPRSAWDLVAEHVPELAEWAGYFQQTSRRRPAAEAGMVGSVSVREADDLLRDADAFLVLVSRSLGLPQRHAFAVTRAVVSG
jgi:hypothetical protein